MCDEVAEIVRSEAGIAQGSLKRARRKLGVGVTSTRCFVSARKVSADVTSADAEPSRENQSLPSDVDLKTRLQTLEQLNGGDGRTRQCGSHSQQAHRARVSPGPRHLFG